MQLQVDQRLLEIIVAGINELPTKVGRLALNEIERQVTAHVEAQKPEPEKTEEPAE